MNIDQLKQGKEIQERLESLAETRKKLDLIIEKWETGQRCTLCVGKGTSTNSMVTSDVSLTLVSSDNEAYILGGALNGIRAEIDKLTYDLQTRFDAL